MRYSEANNLRKNKNERYITTMSRTSGQKIMIAIAAVAVFASASAPFVASAATTANSTVKATVGSTISITSLGTVPTLTLTPGASAVESRQKDTITVNSNSTAGYAVTLSNTSSTIAGLVDGANSIGAHTGTRAAPTALGVNKWGFALVGTPFSASYTAVSNETSSTDLWAGVPLSGAPVTIVDKTGVASNDATDVWYGAKVDSTQPTSSANGYVATVVYTATAK